MEKPIVYMINWQLMSYDGVYGLTGTTDDHPKLGRNVYISKTSPLTKYSLKEDILKYETANTIYMCPLKYMFPKPYGDLTEAEKELLVYNADRSDNCLDKIIGAAAKIILGKPLDDEYSKRIFELEKYGQAELAAIEQRDNERLFEQASKYANCVYLEVTSIENGDKLAYHLGDKFGIVKPNIHIGMIQDSILYMNYDEEEDCRIEFCYFPQGDSMQTYKWSENIAFALIRNNTDRLIWFNGEEIDPGSLEVFTQEE